MILRNIVSVFGLGALIVLLSTHAIYTVPVLVPLFAAQLLFAPCTCWLRTSSSHSRSRFPLLRLAPRSAYQPKQGPALGAPRLPRLRCVSPLQSDIRPQGRPVGRVFQSQPKRLRRGVGPSGIEAAVQ